MDLLSYFKTYEAAYRRYTAAYIGRITAQNRLKVVQATVENDILNTKFGGDEKALGSNQAARDRAMILELEANAQFDAASSAVNDLLSEEREAQMEKDIAEMELKVLVAQAGAPKTVFIR